MNIFTKSFCLCLFFIWPAIIATAQLPNCTGANANLIYYLSVTGTIENLDPTLPLSATNPTLNTISPQSGSIGISLGKNLNAASPAITFYLSVSSGTGYEYYYYNGTTWVNTGYNSGFNQACNPGSGGNYIYNMSDGNGDVYRYDGTANGTFLNSVPGWDGPHDVQGDCAGNFYILSCNANQWLHEFNSSGTIINTWTLTSMTPTSSGGGMGIINNHVYANNTSGFWDGLMSATNVAFTLVAAAGLNPSPYDFSTCPLGGTSSTSNIDTAFYCGSGPAVKLSSPGQAPYTWTVVSGPAVISTTGTSGDTVNVTASSTSQITVASAPSSSSCVSGTDTFLLVVPTVAVSANGGLPLSILGCGTYIDSLNATFTNNASWLNYHYSWSPAAAVHSGDTTLNPVIDPNANTTYVFTVNTDTLHGHCIWQDSVKVTVVDQTVSANFTDSIYFGCKGDTVVFNHPAGKESTWRWNFGDGGVAGDAGSIDTTDVSPTHIYNVQGIYNTQLYVANATCKDSANHAVNTRHPLSASFKVSETLLCQGQIESFSNTSIDTTRLGITPSYNWYFGDGGTSTSFSPTYTYGDEDTGLYTAMLVVQDFVPCYDTAYETVNVITKPSIYNLDSAFCSPNTNIPIGMLINNADSYLWSTGATTPTIIPDTEGVYSVAASNYCGTNMSSVKVTLYDCDKCLFVPTAFTPNDDGLNDVFHVRLLCPIRSYGIKIFNRYGQVVYSNYDVSEGWDGKFNGIPVDIGTYLYEITYTPELPNAHQLFRKGDITVVR